MIKGDFDGFGADRRLMSFLLALKSDLGGRKMLISLPSIRSAVAGFVGASALSGAMVFAALPMANAAPAPVSGPVVASAQAGHADLVSIWHHDAHHRKDLHHSVNIF